MSSSGIECMWRTGVVIFMFWALFSKASFIAPHTVSSSKAMAARRSPLGIVHTFSGLGLDRSRVETELKEAAAFESALKSDGAGTFCLWWVGGEEAAGQEHDDTSIFLSFLLSPLLLQPSPYFMVHQPWSQRRRRSRSPFKARKNFKSFMG